MRLATSINPTGFGLVADLLMGASYASTDATNPIATCTVTFKRDGTWTVTVGAGDALAGTPTSGTWASSPSASVGDNYEVEYSNTGDVGAPGITNNAAVYTALTADRTFTISKATTFASTSFTAKVRMIGTSNPVVQDTTTLSVDGT